MDVVPQPSGSACGWSGVEGTRWRPGDSRQVNEDKKDPGLWWLTALRHPWTLTWSQARHSPRTQTWALTGNTGLRTPSRVVTKPLTQRLSALSHACLRRDALASPPPSLALGTQGPGSAHDARSSRCLNDWVTLIPSIPSSRCQPRKRNIGRDGPYGCSLPFMLLSLHPTLRPQGRVYSIILSDIPKRLMGISTTSLLQFKTERVKTDNREGGREQGTDPETLRLLFDFNFPSSMPLCSLGHSCNDFENCKNLRNLYPSLCVQTRP